MSQGIQGDTPEPPSRIVPTGMGDIAVCGFMQGYSEKQGNNPGGDSIDCCVEQRVHCSVGPGALRLQLRGR